MMLVSAQCMFWRGILCNPFCLFSGRSDLVSGIDTDALDFSQLESYINENIEDGPP